MRAKLGKGRGCNCLQTAAVQAQDSQHFSKCTSAALQFLAATRSARVCRRRVKVPARPATPRQASSTAKGRQGLDCGSPPAVLGLRRLGAPKPPLDGGARAEALHCLHCPVGATIALRPALHAIGSYLVLPVHHYLPDGLPELLGREDLAQRLLLASPHRPKGLQSPAEAGGFQHREGLLCHSPGHATHFQEKSVQRLVGKHWEGNHRRARAECFATRAPAAMTQECADLDVPEYVQLWAPGHDEEAVPQGVKHPRQQVLLRLPQRPKHAPLRRLQPLEEALELLRREVRLRAHGHIEHRWCPLALDEVTHAGRQLVLALVQDEAAGEDVLWQRRHHRAQEGRELEAVQHEEDGEIHGHLTRPLRRRAPLALLRSLGLGHLLLRARRGLSPGGICDNVLCPVGIGDFRVAVQDGHGHARHWTRHQLGHSEGVKDFVEATARHVHQATGHSVIATHQWRQTLLAMSRDVIIDLPQVRPVLFLGILVSKVHKSLVCAIFERFKLNLSRLIRLVPQPFLHRAGAKGIRDVCHLPESVPLGKGTRNAEGWEHVPRLADGTTQHVELVAVAAQLRQVTLPFHQQVAALHFEACPTHDWPAT
mmetsp:Transcript_58584/g.188294  ORF Transcript_58584/g.188294 Transcript_58584/m.188294 type:complete len:596 (+) Transcript_58584:279-2066(+)